MCPIIVLCPLSCNFINYVFSIISIIKPKLLKEKLQIPTLGARQ